MLPPRVQEAQEQGLLDPQLGRPRTRRPRTAIVNFVSFHVEVRPPASPPARCLAFCSIQLYHCLAQPSRGLQGAWLLSWRSAGQAPAAPAAHLAGRDRSPQKLWAAPAAAANRILPLPYM